MIKIDQATAARFMLTHHHLHQFGFSPDKEGLYQLLCRLRCLQLDPLSPMGTSPDMVGIARVRGFKTGDWFRLLLPGLAFEHWAKERCLLPDYAFPYYRDEGPATIWMRMKNSADEITAEVLDNVLAEVRSKGPLTPNELTDHGKVTPLDWSGWKGTSNMGKRALDLLWIKCALVIAGRTSAGKQYDIPERTLAHVHNQPAGDFHRFGLLERVEACGLLGHHSGPHWSTIDRARKSALPHQLVAEGLLAEVCIEGDSRRYWAPSDFLERPVPPTDNHMRILGPLDPFMWDRKLIQHLFGFAYVWEVYKPPAVRQWGWYVCPLLHKGRLVGRIEARVKDDTLVVNNLWPEPKKRINRAALKAALNRHAKACGAQKVLLPDT